MGFNMKWFEVIFTLLILLTCFSLLTKILKLISVGFGVAENTFTATDAGYMCINCIAIFCFCMYILCSEKKNDA